MECQVLTLAGLWNSGPTHWQTLWEQKHAEWDRVAHRDWSNPDKPSAGYIAWQLWGGDAARDWIHGLRAALREVGV